MLPFNTAFPQVCVLDAASGTLKAKFNSRSKGGVRALAASPDGGMVLVAGSALALWDVGSEERLRKLTGHPVRVETIMQTSIYCFGHLAALSCLASQPEIIPLSLFFGCSNVPRVLPGCVRCRCTTEQQAVAVWDLVAATCTCIRL